MADRIPLDQRWQEAREKLGPLEHPEHYPAWYRECRDLHGLTCNGRSSHAEHMQATGQAAPCETAKTIEEQAKQW